MIQLGGQKAISPYFCGPWHPFPTLLWSHKQDSSRGTGTCSMRKRRLVLSYRPLALVPRVRRCSRAACSGLRGLQAAAFASAPASLLGARLSAAAAAAAASRTDRNVKPFCAGSCVSRVRPYRAQSSPSREGRRVLSSAGYYANDSERHFLRVLLWFLCRVYERENYWESFFP